MTKNTDQSDYEYFIVHVSHEHDDLIICSMRDELFVHIKERYFALKNKNLPIFGVSGELKNYVTSKHEARKGLKRMPQDKKRLYEEDVFGKHNYR